jgi:G3E family GTPase
MIFVTTYASSVGDNEIDSKLFELELQKVEEEEQDASQPAGTKSAIAIKEMLNGCMCCVLVGQMKNALLELKELNDPDRIIIETSGSAFPAPIAWQIRELDQSHFNLDSIITVVDCVNFKGYEGILYKYLSIMVTVLY